MTYNYNPLANLTNMPNMAGTLSGWQVPLQLIKRKQVVTDGDVSFEDETINFMGVWQPLRDEQLISKPEGQRSWEWIWLHAVAGTLNLNTADKVTFNNKRYKVMAIKDYSLNGFIEYQLVRDYDAN